MITFGLMAGSGIYAWGNKNAQIRLGTYPLVTIALDFVVLMTWALK